MERDKKDFLTSLLISLVIVFITLFIFIKLGWCNDFASADFDTIDDGKYFENGFTSNDFIKYIPTQKEIDFLKQKLYNDSINKINNQKEKETKMTHNPKYPMAPMPVPSKEHGLSRQPSDRP